MSISPCSMAPSSLARESTWNCAGMPTRVARLVMTSGRMPWVGRPLSICTMGMAQPSVMAKRKGASSAKHPVPNNSKAPMAERINSPDVQKRVDNRAAQPSLARLDEHTGCNFAPAPLALAAYVPSLRRFSMSYQVLARKWRPRSFREMVGQTHVLKALINALDSQRLHHAYLFTGTRGVGKTTIARIIAKCLNCETGITSTPCGECSVCREIDEGRFVDLIEIDAASRTKVEDTRELLDNVQYAPSRGRFKVYLIDEVHMLSSHSFNALLKTLEEPPPYVKFILATTDPQKLPATILSRCLQ